MKTLVLVFHPHLEKSQVNRKLMDAANETGDVTVVDEYAAYPDFKINVEHEQELIERMTASCCSSRSTGTAPPRCSSSGRMT